MKITKNLFFASVLILCSFAAVGGDNSGAINNKNAFITSMQTSHADNFMILAKNNTGSCRAMCARQLNKCVEKKSRVKCQDDWKWCNRGCE
jgi:hypothetical protein